jgi:hypothetical protein
MGDKKMVTSTALAIVQPDELATIKSAGKMLAQSEYFDAKGDNELSIAKMATKILAGRELGFGPFASVTGIHIIQGKPAVGANLLASAVKSSARYDYRVREMTNDVCRLEFFERTGDKWESVGISEFTRADATAAGTQNMNKFARNMLFARAMSNGVRWYAPNVTNGNAVYVPEELGAEVDGEGNVITVTPTIVSTPQDNPFEDEVEFTKPAPPKLSEAQFKHLHAVGTQLYGTDDWDAKRKGLVEWVSKGAISSSRDLSPKEAQRLIDVIEKKIAEIAAQREPVTDIQPELA